VITRRGVLLVGTGIALAGCAHDASTPTAAGTRNAHPSSTTTGAGTSSAPSASASQTTSGPELPTVLPWHPSPGDMVPAAKVAAVRRIERAGNGRDTALQVLEAQYGGLLTDTASVLVVTESWRRHNGAIIRGGHTFDVRLSRRGTSWRVTAVHPSRPGPPAAHTTTTARKVLSDDRIDLPPAARADVRSGQVHDSVLRAMLTLATSHRIRVSVVRSGHPIYVFGTNRLSDHPQGRAFDTWEIDGHAVVDPRTPRTLVTDYMHAVAAAGSYNVGGPYLLGAAPQWFSDNTHHDHVHAGFAQ
jgi:hypothetical protein